VTDLDTAEILFEEDFSSLDTERWTDLGGFPEVKDGVLGGRGDIALTHLAPSWRDYAVEVTYKNIESASIGVRTLDQQNRVDYGFRPFHHLDSGITAFRDGRSVGSAPGVQVQSPRSETIKSMVAIIVKPYPVVLALMLAALVVVSVAQFARVPARTAERAREVIDRYRVGNWPWAAAAALAAIAFSVTLYLNYWVGEGIPHVPDEISYLFQARIFASGHVTAPRPPVEESFDFFNPPLIAAIDDGWLSVYPFAHSLVLAPGVAFGIEWIIPPLVGAGCVVLIFLLARRLYNAQTGVLAALLLAASPFFMMTASNFMSHNTAAFFLLASLTCIAYADRKPLLLSALAGIAFGLLFNTRPLTAVVLMPPFGVLLLSQIIPRDQRIAEVKKIAAFAAGGLIMFGAFMLYNWATVGEPLTTATQRVSTDVIGFGGSHSVTAGITNDQTQLVYLRLVANGWPSWLGLFLVMSPFVLGTGRKWDWLFLACVVAIFGAYTAFYAPGIMHGPRYWYESLPLLVLLTARGADRLAALLADASARWRGSLFGGSPAAPRAAAVIAVYGFLAVMSVTAANDWLRGDGGRWFADAVPNNAEALRDFNGANDNLAQALEDADLDNALVLVEPCAHWQCYGTVFLRNSPWLDGDVILARDLPQRNPALFARFPDRRVYIATYSTPGVRPYGSSAAEDGAPEPEATPPRADEIPSPTPFPTPTPDVAASARRDNQRRADLANVRDALAEYFDRHATYPEAKNMQSLCSYDFDAGCALREVLDPVPRDPSNGAQYWYHSDGATFYTVYARLEAPPGEGTCPGPLHPHLAAEPNLYCVGVP